jgi:hypothetical protein
MNESELGLATQAASFQPAGVAELVDARDLKSLVPNGTCRFDSGPPHHIPRDLGHGRKLGGFARQGAGASSGVSWAY